jgi:hypothetical protein
MQPYFEPTRKTTSKKMEATLTAQLNLNSTQLNLSWIDYIITVLPTTLPTPTTITNFLVYNLILAQLERRPPQKMEDDLQENGENGRRPQKK